MAKRDKATGLVYPSPKEWLAKDWSQAKIADYKPYTMVDGPGIRCALYVSGCLFACPHCYNKKIQDFSYGIPYTEELQQQIIQDLGHPQCQGLSLLGGEPLLNTGLLLGLVKEVRQTYGDDKDIWLWTGYTWEEIMEESEDKLALIQACDVVVDGRYQHSLRNLQLAYRGSSNQRIIDVPKTLASRLVCLWGMEWE